MCRAVGFRYFMQCAQPPQTTMLCETTTDHPSDLSPTAIHGLRTNVITIAILYFIVIYCPNKSEIQKGERSRQTNYVVEERKRHI